MFEIPSDTLDSLAAYAVGQIGLANYPNMDDAIVVIESGIKDSIIQSRHGYYGNLRKKGIVRDENIQADGTILLEQEGLTEEQRKFLSDYKVSDRSLKRLEKTRGFPNQGTIFQPQQSVLLQTT